MALFDEFSATLGSDDKPSQLGSDMFDEVISRPDTKIFVAEDGDKLLGLATFYLLPNIRHGWHRGHIEDMFVTGRVRSQGTGTQLLSAIKAYAREQGVKVIKLDSGNELTPAHHFYQKNGGKTTERFFRFDL
jgi:putative acetyltransferase